MPIPKRTAVTCPNCRKQFETTVFESLNTDFSPDIVEEVIRGECFHAKGPRCGFVAQLEYDLLYHDLKHNAAVWVLHNTNPEYQKKVAEVRASRLLQYDVTRIVPDIDTLREKAACLESGKDDRVVELCKVFMASQLNRQRPDFAFRNAFYTYHSGKDMIYFYDVNGRKATCSLDSKVYDMIGDWFKKPLLQMEKTPYPIMDYKWALRFYKNLSDQEKVGGTAAGQLDEAAAPGPGDTRMPHDSAKPLPKEEALFCRKCGAKLLPNSRFCSSCGAKAVD